MSTSASGWCEAKDPETQRRCDCRQYREAENPDPDRPIRCLECFHGRSLHTGASEPPKKEDKYDVRSILSSLVGSGTNATKGITTTLETAQKETNEGLKKASGSSGSSGLKGKEKPKVLSSWLLWYVLK
jgi:hypothetical protein